LGISSRQLGGMNSVFLLFNKCFFSFLAAGFRPKNLAFARKMMAFSDSGAAAPSPLARTPMANQHDPGISLFAFYFDLNITSEQ